MAALKQSRLEWVDIAKGILIALVVFGHIEPVGVEHTVEYGYDAIHYFKLWISSFHMPAFFIISGLLRGMKESNSSIDLIKVIKKQKKIWIYYLIFSILFFFQWMVKVKTGQYEMDKLYDFAINTITLTGVGVLWFIPAFALSLVIFDLLLKGAKVWKSLYGLILTLFLVLTMLYDIPDATVSNSILVKLLAVIGRALIGSLFMLIGYNVQRMQVMQSKWVYVFIPISLLCFTNSIVDMHYLKFNNVILYYLFSVAGSISIFILSKKIAECAKLLKNTLLKWGGYSLLIMCTHLLVFVKAGEVIVGKFVHGYTFNFILSFILIMVMESIFLLFVEKVEKRYNIRF